MTRSHPPRSRFARRFVMSLILLSVGALSSVPTLAAPSGAHLWTRHYPGDASYAVAVAPDGARVFVGGTIQPAVGEPGEYHTVAYTSAGEVLWSRTYLSPGDSGGTIRAIAVGPDGNRVFVTGESSQPGAGLLDVETIAYRASDGTRLWARRYDGPAEGNDNGFAIEVGPDGATVFVGGVGTGVDSYYDYLTIAYDAATGTRRWIKRYDGSGNGGEDIGYALDASVDGGRVAVTGFSTNPAGGVDVATVAYDAVTGSRDWATRFNGIGDDEDYGSDVVISPDGSRVYVTGRSGRDGSGTFADFITLAYDAETGEEGWARLFDGAQHGQDAALAIAVTPDGSSVVVTGNSIGRKVTTTSRPSRTTRRRATSRGRNGTATPSGATTMLGRSMSRSARTARRPSWRPHPMEVIATSTSRRWPTRSRAGRSSGPRGTTARASIATSPPTSRSAPAGAAYT